MKSLRKSLIVAGCALALLMGCSDDDSRSGWDIGNETDAADSLDSAGDADDADGGTPDYQITFELENRSGQPVYAYQHVAPQLLCTEHGYWLTLEKDGSMVRPFENCEYCECGENACSVCNRGCPQPPSEETTLLDVGESRTFAWDARRWSRTEEGCEEAELMEGESLEATMCWGSGFYEEGQQVLNGLCVTVDFDITPDRPRQIVRVVIPDEEPSPEVTFRLSNETDQDRFAEPFGATEGGDFSPPCDDFWYTVGDGSETFSLRTTCDQCTCDSLRESGSCDSGCFTAACPRSNADDFALGAGSERTDVWDGKIAVLGEVDGTECVDMVDPPTDQLEVTFCHAEGLLADDGDPGGYALDSPTCNTIQFDRMTADEVVLRLQ